jgi:tropomyosin-2
MQNQLTSTKMQGSMAKQVMGVGLIFDQDQGGSLHNGNVFVRTIYKGGSAELEGSIKVGDSIIAIDKQPVHGVLLRNLKDLLKGDLGSYVTLTMERDYDGSMTQYDVSLMRGQAEFTMRKENQRLVEMRQQLAKQLQHAQVPSAIRMGPSCHRISACPCGICFLALHCTSLKAVKCTSRLRSSLTRKDIVCGDDGLLAQVELDALNAALLRSQHADNKDREEIERLKAQIDMEKARLEEIQGLIVQLQAEKDKFDLNFNNQDVKDEIANLTKLLAEAESHLIAAKESLEKDQRITWELEDKWKKEKAARDACQGRIARINAELPGRLEQERIYRENQEALQAKLENSRDKFKAEWEAAQLRRKEELKLLEEAEALDKKSEEALRDVQNENQVIQGKVKDTEKQLRAAEGLRLEVMGKHEALQSDLARMKNQEQVRQQLTVDLQARIEDDYERWQQAVNAAKENRKQDEERFHERERSLMEQLAKLGKEKEEFDSMMQEVIAKLQTRQTELNKSKEDLEQGLAGQRAVSAKLRDEVAKCTAKQMAMEQDIVTCKANIQRLEGNKRALDNEASLSEQRKVHIEAEYEMYLRKEQLRMDFVAEAQQMHKQEVEDINKRAAEVKKSREEAEAEKAKVDVEIERCSEAIRKFQELDKVRRARMEEFKEKRFEAINQFTELLVQQDQLRRLLEDTRIPVSQCVSFYNRSRATTANEFALEYSDKTLEAEGVALVKAMHAHPIPAHHHAQLMMQPGAMYASSGAMYSGAGYYQQQQMRSSFHSYDEATADRARTFNNQEAMA